MSDETVKSYVCGVCKRTAEGEPVGGFVTPHGTIVVCSGSCFVEGAQAMTSGGREPTTIGDMLANAAKKAAPN